MHDSLTQHDSLKRSMVRTAVILLVIQLLIAGAVVAACGLPFMRFLVYLLVTAPYHGLILFGMLKLAHLFVLEETGKPLRRINLSNHLSLFRLSAMPTVIFLMMALVEAHVLVLTMVFISIVFLTDLLDGKLARYLRQVTQIGRYLDSSSDYVVLVGTSIIFIRYELISLTFLLLLLIRLFIVAGGNVFIYLRSGDSEPRTSYLGKASVFAVMGYYGFRLLQFILGAADLHSGGLTTLYGIVDRMGYMTEGVLVVSFFEKAGIFLKTLKAAKRQPAG